MMAKRKNGKAKNGKMRKASLADKLVNQATLYGTKKTVKLARKRAKKSYAAFRDLIRERRRKLKADDRPRFDGIIGDRPMEGKIRASDLRAGQKFAQLLISETRDIAAANPRLKFFSITFLMDEGISLDRAPLVPLESLMAKMYKALTQKGLELNGWTFAEIAAINNHPGRGRGRNLLTHGHALVWSEVHTLASDIEERLRDSRTWSCKLGAKPVRVTLIDQDDLGHPAFWTAYFSKAPHQAKNLRKFKDAEAASGFRIELRDTTNGYRAELGWVLTEVLSYIPLTAMVRSIGDGKYPLARARSKLAVWHNKKCKTSKFDAVPWFDIDKFWKRTKRSRRVKYRRPVILGPELT